MLIIKFMQMKLSVLRCLYVVKVRVTWKYSILFHALLRVSVLLFSQEENSGRNTHCFNFETVNSQVKENILMPKVNRGQGLELFYRFEKERNNYTEFVFNAGFNKLKTKLETDKVTLNFQMNAGYSWGKSLVAGEKIKYYLGVEASYHWSLIEYPVWDESRAYWGSAISAGIFNRVKLLFDNKISLISSLYLDIAGLCSRPDDIRLYAQEEWTLPNIIRITNSGFSIRTLNDFFICSLRNEYRVSLKEDLCFSLCNSIIYSTISETNGQSLQRISISFGIGLGF